ncbi:MAG: hypothetical protein Kow00124_10470 [Anaerolineae bacterium]
MLVKRVFGIILTAVVLGACLPQKELADQAAAPPTPTLASIAPTDEPGGAEQGAQVVAAGPGLSFTVPAGWQETAPGAMQWQRAGMDDAALGFTWAEVVPPAEVEAVLLPADAVVEGAEPLDLVWADSARRYLVEVYRPDGQVGEVDHYEMHVIAVVSGADGRLAFDFYLIAPDRVRLEELLPALDEMVSSSTLGG